jgi:3-phenylpropionate/trans-cinnamate dioxygenase ferredoxin reductase component
VNTGRIVIVGGGPSGLRTAERLRRHGHRGPVTLVGAEAHVAYERPPLSKTMLSQTDEPPTITFLRARDAYDELGLDLRTGTHATALDTAQREVTLDSGEVLAFDRLVIATGVRARQIGSFAGLDGVHTLRTWEDCLALRAALEKSRRVTVVGAGFLGCEVAASARARGVAVDLIEGLDQPLARVLGSTVGRSVADLHARHGVTVRCGTQVSGLEGEGRVERVVLADGARIPTDAVVVAVGAVPNTEWLADSGVALDDGVLCDRTGATSAEDVFASGDVARMPHPYADRSVRTEHWTSASDTAALVAGNLLVPPHERRELSEVPYFWSDQYDAKLQCLGLPAPDDELTVVDGSLEAGAFLGLYSRDGLLTGAAAVNTRGALARCRGAVGARAALAELLDSRPWERV